MAKTQTTKAPPRGAASGKPAGKKKSPAPKKEPPAGKKKRSAAATQATADAPLPVSWNPGRFERVARGRAVLLAAKDRHDKLVATRSPGVFQEDGTSPRTKDRHRAEAIKAYAANHGLLPEYVRRDVELAELAARVDDGDGDPATSPVASGRLHLTPKILNSLLAVENDEDLAARVKELLAAQV